MADHKITFFVCDNGDASLIEAHGMTVMTDINYRQDCMDDENKDVPDFAPTIRKACSDDHLDVFVLTHPDEDHLRGFGEVFHLGDPDKHDDDPKEGAVKIVVDEIWCSPYCADPNEENGTDISKPLLDEIQRRKKLHGTSKGNKSGNRLIVRSATSGALRELASGIEFRVLAPNSKEAKIPKPEKGKQPESTNPSSLVIQWTITVNGRASKVILGGDTSVEVLERLDNDYGDDELGWNILLAPHHCSRLSLGRKYLEDGEEKFDWSKGALAALNHPIGDKAHVVSSSRKFGSKHPPHPKAREKYHDILAGDGDVDDDVRDRFKVTAGKHGDKAKDVVFKFTSRGPTLAKLSAPAVISSPAATGGGGYGRR